MKLSYKASTPDGRLTQGIIEAKDIQEAAYYLRSKDLLPIRISEVSTREFPFLSFLRKSKFSDIMLFTRQLSSMLTSGLTLTQALAVLKDQMVNDSMREITIGIIAEVQEGKPLSVALEKYPKIFSPIYISLVKAGESSGFLDKTLLRLSDNIEKEYKLRSSIKSALLYPVIIIVLMVVVMGIMMIFVVPQLTTLYESLNISLPLPTLIVIGVSKFASAFWPIILGLFVLFIIMYRRWVKTEAGGLIRDDLILKIPIFGKLIRQTILTEFSRTFGLLVSSGTLIVQALNETADVAGNKLYKNAILDIAKRVEKGITVGDGMAAYTIFPPILVQMVRVGEQTGKLDESLIKVSEYFEREVESTIKTLTTAMEPFIMVVLGIAVAFLIISIITPIYNLTSSIQ